MGKENDNIKKELNNTMENLKDFSSGIFSTLSEMSEEILGEDFTEVMKKKSSNVQTQVQSTVENVKDKVHNYKTDLKSEILIPKVYDYAYEIVLSLAGLPKAENKISLTIEDDLLVIEIDSEGVDSNIKQFWSVSKDRLVLDLSNIDDYKASKIKAKHEDGIFIVNIPRVEKEVVKTKINID